MSFVLKSHLSTEVVWRNKIPPNKLDLPVSWHWVGILCSHKTTGGIKCPPTPPRRHSYLIFVFITRKELQFDPVLGHNFPVTALKTEEYRNGLCTSHLIPPVVLWLHRIPTQRQLTGKSSLFGGIICYFESKISIQNSEFQHSKSNLSQSVINSLHVNYFWAIALRAIKIKFEIARWKFK